MVDYLVKYIDDPAWSYYALSFDTEEEANEWYDENREEIDRWEAWH